MRSGSFRTRLFIAMMAVVTGGTAGSLYLSHRSVETAYRHVFEEQFASEVRFVSELQQARLAATMQKCLELARSVRLLAAMEERDNALLQRIALDELRGVLHPGVARRASFFRFVDEKGVLLPPMQVDEIEANEDAGWRDRVAGVGRAAVAGTADQRVGYLGGAAGELLEVIVTGIVDPVGQKRLGALVIAFATHGSGGHREADPKRIQTGVWIDGRLYAPDLARPDAGGIRLVEAALGDPPRSRGSVDLVLGQEAIRVFYVRLPSAPGFPEAHQVTLFSLAELMDQQRDLRREILTAGAAAVLAALVLSLVLARGLSVPIAELAQATGQIQRGRLEVRVPVRRSDELGRLASSFNAMAVELGLKEKLRLLLDQVADRSVAEGLIHGRISRAGEVRDLSVLFADIRGFTALTETMDPAEIVRLLNDHMGLLTAVVHEHGGLVDKFVGDSLMAVFGAPATTGDDAGRAVRCAWTMLRKRAETNVGSALPVGIGIGIASGEAVAGCMGSADRLSYTVLGSRVNLAARLCAAARGGELWIDDTTYQRVREGVAVEPMEKLELKGFRSPVPAYRVTRVSASEP